MDKQALIEEIQALKQERDAVIVAHSYQIGEVQDVADMVGDSFALSKFCAEDPHPGIVFCGVKFMAESAKILSPQKTVLLPEISAGCPMADMVTPQDIDNMRAEYPNAAVVCYVNTTAETKAKCDICCTSSNALQVIKSLPQKDIIFMPDKNLGGYIAQQVPEKNIILWPGYCITHERTTVADVQSARENQPEALLLAHPECPAAVVAEADFVGSTKQIIDYAKASEAQKFIIGTEMGIFHQLQNDSPNKQFYLLSSGLICPNMKKTKLESVYESLKNMQYQIELDPEVIEQARASLERMLAVA